MRGVVAARVCAGIGFYFGPFPSYDGRISVFVLVFFSQNPVYVFAVFPLLDTMVAKIDRLKGQVVFFVFFLVDYFIIHTVVLSISRVPVTL